MEYAGKAAIQQTRDSAQEEIDKVVMAASAAIEEVSTNMEDINRKVSSPLSYNAETETLTLFGSAAAVSEEG